MSDVPTSTKSLPDWWQREKQRRQTWILICLTFVLALIGYFYWVNSYGLIGHQPGITFDSANHISFVHLDDKGNPTLYAIRADGSGIQTLTPDTDKSSKQDPIWTSDGKNLIFASNNNPNQVMQLYIMGSGSPRQMTYGTGNKFAPTLSPDGKHIAFLTQGAVKTVLTNGEQVDQVMPPPRAGHADGEQEEGAHSDDLKGPYLWAGFSADGTHLAAVQSLTSEENPGNLGDLTAGDQVLRVLVNGKNEFLDTGREVSACWEVEGKKLASSFSEYHLPAKEKIGNLAKAEFISGIRVWTFDSGKPVPKVAFLAVDYTVEPRNIAWSPDGTQIAFESWEHKKGGEKSLMGIAVFDLSKNQSFVMNSPKDLVEFRKRMMVAATANGKPQRPRWSPDGSRLLYEVVSPKGGRDLFVVNSDTTNQISLTRDLGGDNSQAVWAPLKK